MVVNVYSVVLGTKKRMQQTFFIFKKKKDKARSKLLQLLHDHDVSRFQSTQDEIDREFLRNGDTIVLINRSDSTLIFQEVDVLRFVDEKALIL